MTILRAFSTAKAAETLLFLSDALTTLSCTTIYIIRYTHLCFPDLTFLHASEIVRLQVWLKSPIKEDTMALSENPTASELKELAEKNPDLEITLRDSTAAGNCESGSIDFLEANFDGRESVKASELVPYIEGYNGVRVVLEYKFRQLEQQAAEKSEVKTEE